MAFTGEEAIGRAEIEIPDLVVVDWMLPERSGLEVCRILRGKRDTAYPYYNVNSEGRGRRQGSRLRSWSR